MAVDNATIVTTLFHGMLLRDPTTEEAAFCQNLLNLNLITPAGLVLAGATTEEFQQITLPIAAMYQAAFGHYATTTELMTWRNLYNTGVSLADMGQLFILSSEFGSNNNSPTTTEEYLQAMAQVGLGLNLQSADLAPFVELVDSGALDYGDLLRQIASINGRDLQVELGMVDACLNGGTPDSATISALGNDEGTAVSTLISESSFFAVVSPAPDDGLSCIEQGGLLTLSGALGGKSLSIDLSGTSPSLTVDGTARPLNSGTLALTSSVNATGLSDGTVSFVGKNTVDAYRASPNGDHIQGGAGDDRLFGGSGKDTFVFESTAALNGIDTIVGFTIGSSGDVLDFSDFLDSTATDNITAIDADSTGLVAWSSGDVLVAVGNGLTTAADISALFASPDFPLAPFAAPSTRGKAVVITSDIVGDASVWYLVNQTDLAAITADEITQVASLDGVNNLGLVGFAATNFL